MKTEAEKDEALVFFTALIYKKVPEIGKFIEALPEERKVLFEQELLKKCL